ncbi:MAG: tRNA pseudouridine(38-40) synthase TruA [Sebaldella sp.]|nr:tRNA pseudouridine(38-40) synthase TruA [Sebaldella sp.]
MKNIKITYEYDGSKFHGFQKQLNSKTVQGSIEKTIKDYFDEDVNLLSSGRTDKGVHALGQVSNFRMEKDIKIDIIKRTINKKLSKEIKILDIEEVGEDFHSRFSAKNRTYLYIMKLKNDISPFESEYVSPLENSVDAEELLKILTPLIGRHNFDSFRKKDKDNKDPEREIIKIECYNKEDKLHILIQGKAFLKTMVRIIIGSALAVYFEKREKDYMIKKLENPNGDDEKILAPSEGLYLYEVEY